MNISVFDEKWPVWDMIRELWDKSFEDVVELDEWDYVKSDYHRVNELEELESGKIFFGDTWNGYYTYDFTKQLSILKQWDNQPLVLNVGIGGECLVCVNDEPLGTIDFGHSRVLIGPHCSNEKITLKISGTRHLQEAAKSKRLNDKVYAPLLFKEITLGIQQSDVRKLYYFASVLLQIVVHEEDEQLTRALFPILKESLLHVKYDESRSEFIRSTIEVYEKLREAVQQLNIPYKYGEMIFMGHSHLDLVFKWREKETIRKVARTNVNTIQVLKRNPTSTMIQSQMKILDYTKEYYKEQYEEMKELVKSGQLELVSGLWTEFDTNIPSTESLIRQVLYGKKYLKEEFGLDSNVCFLPDTFGYSGQLPQLLAKSGYQYFVTSKLEWNEQNRFPYTFFNWEGIDGSTIASYLMPKGYGGSVDVKSVIENFTNARQQEAQVPQLFQYGMGDGGGGISDEMIAYKEAIRDLQSYVHVRDGKLHSYMDQLFLERGDIPTAKGELYFEKHRGVFTSQARIKKFNRMLEGKLYNVEFLATQAALQGNQYPYAQLEKAWKDVLFNQFHDTISGSILHDCVKDTIDIYEEADALLNELIQQTTNELCDTQDHCYTILNTLGWKRDGLFSLSYKGMKPVLRNGNHDVTVVELGEKGEYRYGLVYIADIPAYGQKEIRVHRGEVVTWTEQPMFSEEKESPITEFGNNRYNIVFDGYGHITQIYDKLNNRNVLTEEGQRIEAFYDRAGYFDSWDISEDFERVRKDVVLVKPIELVENNEVRKTAKITQQIGNSIIESFVSIYEYKGDIDFTMKLDMQDKNVLLKSAFHVNVQSTEASYDLSMGHIKRSTGIETSEERAQFEVPMQKWMNVCDGENGVSIVNDCKYGADIKGNKMRITLLKTAVFPDEVQDIGKHELRFSLQPHRETLETSGVVQKGYEMNVPFIVMNGVCTSEFGLVFEKEENIMIESIKCAENGEGLIVRLYECFGSQGQIKIQSHEAMECNLLEEPIQEINCSEGWAQCELNAFEIKTIRLSLTN